MARSITAIRGFYSSDVVGCVLDGHGIPTTVTNDYALHLGALKWGGTIDKFIGDAILVFFGDSETKSAAEDAKACVRMAVEMQNRLAELNIAWRNRGVDEPFRARMEVNTGYGNVGNFGSVNRMEYTIIGAQANLSARLESIAEPDTSTTRPSARARHRSCACAGPD